MTGSTGSAANKRGNRHALLRKAAFPLAVVVLYLVLLVLAPTGALVALETAGQVLIQVALPLCVAFIIMFLLNLFIKPAHISGLLGKGSGTKGVVLSTLAGILSMGPIYAWFPLLNDLREKGASEFHLANFLCNRAVKPFLLPVMASYFGWTFTMVLNLLIVVSSLLTALLVSCLTKGCKVSEELG